MDLFPLLDRVSFELSNTCNYASLHPMCPASLEREPTTLPSKIVNDALEYLGQRYYDGVFSFHHFNEPMTDPRLFTFIERCMTLCPDSKLFLWTNGWNLTQTMMDELVKSGVYCVITTGYTDAERRRLERIKAPIDYRVQGPNWVEVIKILDKKTEMDVVPCKAPLTELIVNCRGHVKLCCRDFGDDNILFDLNRHGFSELMRSRKIYSIYRRLSSGDRFLPICKRCGTARDWTKWHGRRCEAQIQILR